MLVLRRTTNETIYIGPDIELTVVQITGGSVKIGITAPRHVEISRAELGRPRSHAPEFTLDDHTNNDHPWSSPLEQIETSVFIG